jgi:hypothetical protein
MLTARASPMRQVIGVIGAGQMGAGIAQVCATKGLQVIISDRSQVCACWPGPLLWSHSHDHDRNWHDPSIFPPHRRSCCSSSGVHSATHLKPSAHACRSSWTTAWHQCASP